MPTDRATVGRKRLTGLWYVLPAGAVYLPIMMLPVLYCAVLSCHRWDGLTPHWQFVGLDNFRELLSDRVFWRALSHNVALLLFSVLIQLPAAMLLAVVVARVSRLQTIVRSSVFLPYVLPSVVIALVWRLLIESSAPQLLGSVHWSLPSIMLAIGWRFVGFHTVLYLAGLAAIDPQLEEAARLDGAGSWQTFRCITLPLLRPVIAVSVTLAAAGSMKYFDIVFIMTRGGPARATELVATYMYKETFESFRFGYGAALALALLLLAAVVSAVSYRLIARSD